jgi:hypothetical protein
MRRLIATQFENVTDTRLMGSFLELNALFQLSPITSSICCPITLQISGQVWHAGMPRMAWRMR